MTDKTGTQTKLLRVNNIPRLFVGLILISTGIGKLLDMSGFVLVLDAYQMMPHWMSSVIAYTLPFIELFIGLALICSPFPKFAAWGAVLLHGVMLAVVTMTYHRGIPIENCGCFGVFLARPLTLQTLFEDLLMLIMSMLALFLIDRTSPSASRSQPAR